MKATIKSHAGSLIVEVDAPDIKGLFAKISDVQDVIDAASKCGMPDCGAVYLRYVCRQNEGYTFYELLCLKCFARLQFGQRKEGGALFARRKNDNGDFLPNHGWSKYEAQK